MNYRKEEEKTLNDIIVKKISNRNKKYVLGDEKGAKFIREKVELNGKNLSFHSVKRNEARIIVFTGEE